MMFDKRNKKIIKYIWTGLSILIIASMILFLMPGLIGGY